MRLTNALFRAGRQPTRPSPLCRSAGLLGAAARAAAAWTSYGGLEKANGIISDLMAHVGEAAERRRRWQKEGVITFPPDMGDVTDEEMEEWLLVGIPPIDQFSPD